MGRPSDYDPAYCDLVIEMGKKGYSVVEMATEIGNPAGWNFYP